MNKCKGCPLTPDICHGGKPDCDIRDDKENPRTEVTIEAITGKDENNDEDV